MANGCNWDVLDARYVDEGFPICDIRNKEKRAVFYIRFDMQDKEALDQIAPCLKAQPYPIQKGKIL